MARNAQQQQQQTVDIDAIVSALGRNVRSSSSSSNGDTFDTTSICGMTNGGKVTRDNVQAFRDRIASRVPFTAAEKAIAADMVARLGSLKLTRKDNVDDERWEAFRANLRLVADGTLLG